MYRSSKTIAVLASFAVLGAAPVFAGGASVPNTSTATTSLSALSTVPSGGGSGSAAKTVGGGGGTPSAGFTGMAAYHFKDSLATSYYNAGFGTPTTLNGVPARVFPYTASGASYNIVLTEAGDFAVYPAD